MAKDIFGNEIDAEDLDSFEQDGKQEGAEDKPQEKPDDDDYSDVVNQLESGKEIELDPDKPVGIRKQKKSDRWHQHTQKAEQERIARLEAERRAEVAEREAQVWRQAVQQTNKTEPISDDNDEINKMYDQQANLYDLYNRKAEAGNITPEETERFKKEVRSLQTKIFETTAKRVMQSQPQQDIGQQALKAQLQMQYPEIFRDQRASTYADGLFRTKIATGEPNSIETVKKTLNETAKRFGYTNYAVDADDATKRSYAGPPARGSSAKTASTPKIVITKDILKIANATYPQMESEKDRLKEWIRVHGKDYAEGLKSEQS